MIKACLQHLTSLGVLSDYPSRGLVMVPIYIYIYIYYINIQIRLSWLKETGSASCLQMSLLINPMIMVMMILTGYLEVGNVFWLLCVDKWRDTWNISWHACQILNFHRLGGMSKKSNQVRSSHLSCLVTSSWPVPSLKSQNKWCSITRPKTNRAHFSTWGDEHDSCSFLRNKM